MTLAVLFTHHGLGECLNGAANNSALSDNDWPKLIIPAVRRKDQTARKTRVIIILYLRINILHIIKKCICQHNVNVNLALF